MKSVFKVPLQTEVEAYIKTKMNWPDQFCKYYADKFWNHYQASGWKLSSGNRIKDWKACFNSQWQVPKFKEDIEKLNGKTMHTSAKPTPPPARNEVEALDQLLERYTLHPTQVPFSEFGKWYDYMKSEKLLKPLTKGDIDYLTEIYQGDNYKCRCACVQMTMDGYVNSGFTFCKVYEVRMRLA